MLMQSIAYKPVNVMNVMSIDKRGFRFGNDGTDVQNTSRPVAPANPSLKSDSLLAFISGLGIAGFLFALVFNTWEMKKETPLTQSVSKLHNTQKALNTFARSVFTSDPLPFEKQYLTKRFVEALHQVHEVVVTQSPADTPIQVRDFLPQTQYKTLDPEVIAQTESLFDILRQESADGKEIDIQAHFKTWFTQNFVKPQRVDAQTGEATLRAFNQFVEQQEVLAQKNNTHANRTAWLTAGVLLCLTGYTYFFLKENLINPQKTESDTRL